jgi:regulator of cell morphogenesis and NO signaling
LLLGKENESMPIQSTETLAQIVVDHPKAAGVFARYALDFCCHGGRTLQDACAEQGLEPAVVLGELERMPAPDPAAPNWKDRPLAEVVDFILDRYHAPLRKDVAGLIALADRVERVHGGKPSCPRGLTAHLGHVLDALESHLGKEEQILFPMIRAGQGAMAQMPMNVMMHEHEEHGESLRRTRELTGDLVIPPEACSSWRALYSGLQRLEAELMEHIHLENHVLFPRAINGDGGLDA